MRTLLGSFVVLCLLALSSFASAETLTPGQRYVGPKTLDVPTLSLRFDLPSGWTGVLPSGTEWFHVGKDDEVGRVFMWATHATDAQVRSTMKEGFVAAGAVQLSPVGELRQEGSTLVGDYSASDGTTTYKAQVRSRSSGGVAVAVVAVAPADKLAGYVKLAAQIEKSVKFGVSSTGQGVGKGQWAAALSGRKFARIHTKSGASGGYSEKDQYDLCSDGRFFRKFRASSRSDLGSGVSSNKDGGTWSVQGNQLVLKWSEGAVSQHTLEDRGGQVHVDGQRWMQSGAATSCQ